RKKKKRTICPLSFIKKVTALKSGGRRFGNRGAAGPLDERTAGVGWQGTGVEPVVGPFEVELELLAFGFRAVGAEDFGETTVAAGRCHGYDDAVNGIVSGASADEFDLQCHNDMIGSFREKKEIFRSFFVLSSHFRPIQLGRSAERRKPPRPAGSLQRTNPAKN